MVDKKNNSGTNIGMASLPEPLSDETIDELGYAKFTATSDTSLPASQSATTSAMAVTGPTKSPPPVLMPRPRPAIHPTLKLTNAFANPEPTLSPTPSPSTSLPDDYPEQPPSTYLTPPLAPPLKPVATPTPGGLSELPSTTQQQQQQTKEEVPSGEPAPSITPSPPPTRSIMSDLSIGGNSNLNHHQISSKTSMATQQQSIQSEEQEAGQQQHPTTVGTASNDDVRPHAGILVRKPGAITLTASTSAPLVPSPLVKSTLASQLSSSSSSSSSGSQHQQHQDRKENPPMKQEQKEQQHHQQRRLRKSLSTEQLPKSGPSGLQHSDSFTQHHHHQQQQQQPMVEKLIYSGSGKSNMQQLQQEYLLRQNGYLRRQVDALKFDNMESQRQHQELATRMKQLEIQLLEEKKRQTPHQNPTHGPLMTANEYQHHHYYHHNVFAPPPMDSNYSSEGDEEELDMEHSVYEGKGSGGDNGAATKKWSGQQFYEEDDDNLRDQHLQQRQHDGHEKSMEEEPADDKHHVERRHDFSPTTRMAAPKRSLQSTNQQKRPILDQRRHSSHIAPIPSTSDSLPSTMPPQQQQQRFRQRHVTAPSLPHHYRGGGPHGQQDPRGSVRQRSRSVPKNEHLHPSPRSHYRQQQQQQQQQQVDRMHRGKPIYLSDNDQPPPHQHHHHNQPKGMFPLQQSHFSHQGFGSDDTDENMEMESDEELEPGTGFENEDDYFYDDIDDDGYLEELNYYRHHMAATAPGPPMIYYPPPPSGAFFNDHYATMPPMPPLLPPPPPPLPLQRRKSASALRPPRAGSQGFMDVMNPDHYERPHRAPVRRNWNNHQANHLRQMHPPPPPQQQQQQQRQHVLRGYRGDPVHYGPRQRGQPPPPPPSTMSIAGPPPRSGSTADHHSTRKPSAMASPRMTTLPLRRPMMTRGSSIGSYPGRV
ncbi:unnamed protein product [Absidia cylindrospora]